MKGIILLSLFCLGSFLVEITAQETYLPIVKLGKEHIELQKIDLRYGNIYVFGDTILEDTFFFSVPYHLPRGYYEAYYNNDSNHLALTYYNFGNKSYAQQYYEDGSMKSDSEYDRLGRLHGMHVVYNKAGNEVWHADYQHGLLDRRNSLDYLEKNNTTKELLSNKEAFGCYEFTPTPMRARHDQIHFREDGTFSYHNFNADCKCRRHSEGQWTLTGELLRLQIDEPEVWQGDTIRTYAIMGRRWRQRLMQVLPFGVHWYASEYWLCKKCICIQKED